MTEKLIGREYECDELKRCLESDRSELVIVYGCRIGKTFLIKQYFEKHFNFWFVGVRGLTTKNQLRRFAKVLKHVSFCNFAYFMNLKPTGQAVTVRPKENREYRKSVDRTIESARRLRNAP